MPGVTLDHLVIAVAEHAAQIRAWRQREGI